MRYLLVLMLLGPAAHAERPAYQANSGVLFMGGVLLYHDTEGPLSFVSLTESELPADAERIGPVFGKGCQHGLSVPLSSSFSATKISGAAGRGGTRKALEMIRKKHGEFRGLYDVMIDVHITSILGIYRRQCIEIHARAFR